MYLGRVVECGATEEVLEAPQHPYTRALLSVVPEIEQLEPVVLTGEIPTRRGSRRLPVPPPLPPLADGRAAAAGVAAGCVGVPLEVLSATGDHRAACHLDHQLVRR